MSDILIVDDDAGVRQFLKAALSRQGLVFRVAINGARALDAVADAWPAVVLLDLEPGQGARFTFTLPAAEAAGGRGAA